MLDGQLIAMPDGLQANVYGGTHELVHFEFPALGIKHTMVDPMDSSTWEDAIQPGTKARPIPSTPILQVAESAKLPAILSLFTKHLLRCPLVCRLDCPYECNALIRVKPRCRAFHQRIEIKWLPHCKAQSTE